MICATKRGIVYVYKTSQNHQTICAMHSFLGTLLIASILPSSGELMAQNAFAFTVSVVGSTSGPIDGGNVQKGRERTIIGYSLSHEMNSPRDAAGMATGKLQYKPVTLTLDTDKAAPLLMSAMSRNESLSTVTIKCYEAGGSGAEVNYYTMTLTNASISNIQTAMGPGRSNPQFPTSDMPSGTFSTDLLKVSFVYQSMTVVYAGGPTFTGQQ